MTYSEVLDCYSIAYSDIASHLDDLLSSAWLWDQPSKLPKMYVQNPTPPVIAPHVKTMTHKQFAGNLFKLGGSKK